MTNPEISSVLKEKRVFPPPAEFAAAAHVGSMERYRELYRRSIDDPEAVVRVGVEHATAQCKGLLEGGAPGVHFYTLNKSPATREVFLNLKRMRLL